MPTQGGGKEINVRKILTLCAAAICLAVCLPSVSAEETEYISDFTMTVGSDRIWLSGGDTIRMDTKPYIKDGRTYIPLRAVCETMKAQVDYIPQTETVVIEDDTLTAKTDIGSNIIAVSFKDENIAPITIETDAVSEINEDGRTMVPMRAVTESLFGCSVGWDELNQRISVSRSYQTKRLIVIAETPGNYADGLYGFSEYSEIGDNEYTVQFEKNLPDIVIKQYRNIIAGKPGVEECIPEVMLKIEF